MTITESFTDVTPIAEYFKAMTGVTFERQSAILKNKVITFCRQHQIDSFSALLRNIKQDIELEQRLIDHLTTTESFFYREFKQIESLVDSVKKIDTHVHILCAPSATGEEPYSIAIALLEARVPKERFSIIGIDINSEAVDKAKEARYKERDVRNLSTKILDHYFAFLDGYYHLHPDIKMLVSFKQLNLFDPSFKELGRFDLIFSRNMLIYFDKATKMKAKEILESMRKDDRQAVFFGHADLF